FSTFPYTTLFRSPSRAYEVLATVSHRYSSLKGRLPTCYSPVRHCTHGLLHFPVRLACVKRAASVDSEPGSNSRLMFLSCIVPLVLRVLTKCFLLHPTRLSMICAQYLPAFAYRKYWQASKLAQARADNR